MIKNQDRVEMLVAKNRVEMLVAKMMTGVNCSIIDQSKPHIWSGVSYGMEIRSIQDVKNMVCEECGKFFQDP